MTENVTTRKTKKDRSPSYPSLSLDVALERAKQLWDREKRNYAPVPAMLEAWGYGPKSSGGMLAIAALKRFELLEDKGTKETREARLTEFAQAILLDEREDSTERMERIREAALKPKIFNELWTKYEGDFPSEATMRYYLTVERGFTEGAAIDLIKKFKRTLIYADLTAETDNVSETSEQKESDIALQKESKRPVVTPVTGKPKGMTSGAPDPIQFPVYGATVVLQATAPLTEQAWDQMMEILNMLKPSAVAAPPSDGGNEETFEL